MSEYVKPGITFDLTKNIKDLEINTGFILGLDDVVLYFIANVIDDPSTIGKTFAKFKELLSNGFDENKPLEFNHKERMLYTIFSIQQLLKAKAIEQNLHIELESKITQDDIKNYMMNVMSSEDDKANEKIESLMSLVKPKSS